MAVTLNKGPLPKFAMRHGQSAREQEEEAAVTLLGGIPVRDSRAGPQR